MSEQPEISRFVTAVFRAWRQGGIDCLVLRNYEGLPAHTTNDIDVLVAPDQRARAERALLQAAAQTGFRLHSRVEYATLALYLSSTETNAQTHFDLFTSLKWRGFEFVDSQQFLRRKVDKGLFWVPHPADETATKLLASLIYTRKVKEKYKGAIAAGLKEEGQAVAALLSCTYGTGEAQRLVEAGGQERWGEIEAVAGRLRRGLVLRQLAGRPLRTLGSLARDAARLTRRFLQPPGVTVVLCGADGSGKSTAARVVLEELEVTFPTAKVRQFHWKPPVFTGKRQAARAPTTDPHGKPARNALLSLAYFGVHWLEFLLGSHLRLRPLAFRGTLILIDRFYYDFFIDQRRYRLRVPQGLVRLGHALLKKPDLVVLLDAPAEVLQRRKQEVPLAETERQRAAFLPVVRGLQNGTVIDATQPPGKVGGAISRAILDFMALRTRQRWGSLP